MENEEEPLHLKNDFAEDKSDEEYGEYEDFTGSVNVHRVGPDRRGENGLSKSQMEDIEMMLGSG